MRIHGQSDRQTDMAKLSCATFKVVTEKVLQVNTAQRPGRLQHNPCYHWPCRTKVQCAVKKQNMTTVHILTLHSAHISTFSFCTQQTPKIFQHETSYCSSQCVSVAELPVRVFKTTYHKKQQHITRGSNYRQINNLAQNNIQ